jgi:hypothetical protein
LAGLLALLAGLVLLAALALLLARLLAGLRLVLVLLRLIALARLVVLVRHAIILHDGLSQPLDEPIGLVPVPAEPRSSQGFFMHFRTLARNVGMSAFAAAILKSKGV